MDAKAATALALRLLELEQRFESYCTLHEEELKEIGSTLNHLRADMLASSRTLYSPETGKPETAACGDGDGTGEESLDSLPILAL